MLKVEELKDIDPRLLEKRTEDFNCTEFVLSILPEEDLTDEYFHTTLQKYKKGLSYVDGQLSTKILENYHSFVMGMQKIRELGHDLRKTLGICKRGKSTLNKTKSVVKNGLYVISKKRKFHNLGQTERILRRVRKFQKVEKELGRNIKGGRIVEMCQGVRKLKEQMDEIHKFGNIFPFMRKTQETYERRAKRKLRTELLKNFSNFNAEKYPSVVEGLTLLNMGLLMGDSLRKYYEKELERIVELGSGKKNEEEFEAGIFLVINSLTKCLYNYQRLYKWHEKNSTRFKIVSIFRKELWEKMRSNLKYFFGTVDFKRLKINAFFNAYMSFHMLFDLGYEFCQIHEENLKSILNDVSKRFFLQFHRNSVMDEFLLLLENEFWQELQFSFSYQPLLEQLGYSEKYRKYAKLLSMSFGKLQTSEFERLANEGKFMSIYHKKKKDEDEEEGENSEDEDLDDEEKGGARLTMVLINISKTVINKFQFYLDSMEILKPLVKTIFYSFRTLVNFYIYSLFSLFIDNPRAEGSESEGFAKKVLVEWKQVYPEKGKRSDYNVSKDLHDFMRRTRRNLDNINKQSMILTPFPLPKLSMNIKSFFGLKERCIMIESFNIIKKVLVKLKPRLNHLMHDDNSKSLIKFYRRLKVYDELKEILYRNLVDNHFEMKDYDVLVMNCSYNSKSVDNFQPNKFVSVFVNDFDLFAKMLSKNGIRRYSKQMIWKYALDKCLSMILTGFSKVKKCNAIGRGQMQFDFVSFRNSIQRISQDENIFIVWSQKVDLIQSFLNAFYLDKFEEIVQWVRNGKDSFTKEQLKNFILQKASKSVDKSMRLAAKNKSKLLKLLQEIYDEKSKK